MPEMPEYVPEPFDVDLMRHEVIDGETYVNLDDLIQVLAIKMNDLDNTSIIMVNKYKNYAFPTAAAALFNMGTTVGLLYGALKAYAEAAVFDSIINLEENPNE